jgi:GR25 family glycosyltransferase involved in LPS biosynthesis
MRLFINHIRFNYNAQNNFRVVRRYSKEVKNAFVISLPFRDDKKFFIAKTFARCNMNFQFIDGIFLKANDEYLALFRASTLKNLTHGALGCIASHIKTLTLISRCTDGLYTVFEDDVILSPDFRDGLAHISNHFPSDADIFYLGGGNLRKRDIEYFVEENVFRAFNPRKGMYAYIVTPKGAKRILNEIIPFDLFCGGIDTKIGSLVREGKIVAYQWIPALVTVNLDLPSNIFNPSNIKKLLHSSTIKWLKETQPMNESNME